MTTKILPACTPKTGLTAANLDDDPPGKSTMVDLGFGRTAAPRYVEAVIVGEDSTARALTGAYWFGWHAALDLAVLLGPVNGGYDVSVSTTKAHRDVLDLVAGVYTHIGIGKGTLAASTVALQVYPLEVDDD